MVCCGTESSVKRKQCVGAPVNNSFYPAKSILDKSVIVCSGDSETALSVCAFTNWAGMSDGAHDSVLLESMYIKTGDYAALDDAQRDKV